MMMPIEPHTHAVPSRGGHRVRMLDRQTSLAGLVWFGLCALMPILLSAGESGKAEVSVAMVRVVVSTPNPAVNQTYELEVDSFNGQSLRGFEPEQAPGGVRSLISIDMASVKSLEFFQRNVERETPALSPAGGEADTPRNSGNGREPSKDLLRRFDHLVHDKGEAQLARIFETLKSTQEYQMLQRHLQQRIEEAETTEEIQASVRLAMLVEYLQICTAGARNFEHTTSAQYFEKIPQFLREAQAETSKIIQKVSTEKTRAEADKFIDVQDFRAAAKPLAERVWNQTVPPERAVQPTARRMGNNGPKPFRNGRPGRPGDPPPPN